MYFCYLSRNKIDDMYETLRDDVVLSEKRTRTTEKDINGELEASVGIPKIIDLIKGGLGFGYKGIMQYEKEVKQTYVNKLRYILENIDVSGNLTNDLLEGKELTKRYYLYEGNFRVSNGNIDYSKQKVVTIESNIFTEFGDYVLVLDCSMKNFSDVSPDGSYEIHSSNYGFFTRRMRVRFQTVFILLSAEDNVIYGSPLYLLLNDDGIIL